MKMYPLFAKKGQLSLFALLGIVLIIIVIFLVFATKENNTSSELAQIESITDAKTVVESCIEETITKDLILFGQYGGYNFENRTVFSSFGTAYNLPLSIDELEINLESGLERDLGDCSQILENTPYELVSSGRIGLDVQFQDSIVIKGGSIGRVQTRDSTGVSGQIFEINEERKINMPEIYEIAKKIVDSDQGIPLFVTQGYTVNTFINEENNEILIEIYQEDPLFLFRITL